MEEKESRPAEEVLEEERGQDIDLNALFPGKGYDLNRLFPDEGTKKLLHELKRNKREIDRFIRSLEVEEEDSMRCPHCHEMLSSLSCPCCGGENPDKSLYCCWCGSRMEKLEEGDFSDRIL